MHVLCAVLEKGVVLSKQVGIKQVDSGCLQTMECRCNELLCVLSATIHFTLQYDLSV